MIQEYQKNEGRSCRGQCSKSNKAKERDQLLKTKLLESYCISPCRRKIPFVMYREITYRNLGPKLTEGESAQDSLFQCHSVTSTHQGTNINESRTSSCSGERKGHPCVCRKRQGCGTQSNTENSLTLRKSRLKSAGSSVLSWAFHPFAQQVKILLLVQTREIREIPFPNVLFAGTQHLAQC